MNWLKEHQTFVLGLIAIAVFVWMFRYEVTLPNEQSREFFKVYVRDRWTGEFKVVATSANRVVILSLGDIGRPKGTYQDEQ